MSAIEIAAPTRDQAGVLSALHTACFAPRGERGWSADEISSLIANPSVCGAALCENEKVLGFILAQYSHDEAEILTVCVDPARQGLGFGAKLLKFTMNDLRSRGIISLFLEFSVDNDAARHLYLSLGFEACGTRPDYYARKSGNKVSAQVMRIDL